MNANNLFQKMLTGLYNNFHNDTAKMIIYTSVAGYALSSFAQMAAIAFSSKFSNEQKSFLLPQECGDALANIATFLAITTLTKKTVAKLFSTGKWAPKNVKEYLMGKPELAKRVGKLDFVVSDCLPNETLLNDYNSCKALGTTVATIGAGILSSNIVTPLIRNNLASRRQKRYIAKTQEIADMTKSIQQEHNMMKPNYSAAQNYSTGLKI